MILSATQEFVNAEHHKIFDETKDIPGWQAPGDSFKLYELAYTMGDVILEIGTFGGRSAVVELRGALANPERTGKPQFFGIDIDFAGVWRTLNSLEEHGFSERSLVFHGNLELFIQKIDIEPTMVFLDGDHQYPGVKADLALLSQFIRPGIPILCHDYTNPGNDTGELGVKRAVNEFVEEGYAELIGTFGVSALLMTSEKCQGQGSKQYSESEFAHERANLLWSYTKNLFVQVQQQKQKRESLSAQLEEAKAAQVEAVKAAQLEAAKSAASHVSIQEPAPTHEPPKSVKSLKPLRRKLKKVRRERQQFRQQRDEARNRIEAMESSKFWKMRSLWFRLKGKS